MHPAPLILTLRFDPDTFAVLDGLRRTHFPPDRNVVPAHVTLLHDLPGAEEAGIRQTLDEVCAEMPLLHLAFPKLRFLGRGVAVEVDAPQLLRVRKMLAGVWAGWLTPQDRQPYRPHVTIQNKVPAHEARRLYEWLSSGWSRFDGRGEGLLLWHYRGGPWEPAGDFPFTGDPTGSGNGGPGL